MFGEPGAELRLGEGAGELGDDRAVVKNFNVWNAPNPELRGEIGMRFGVDFHEHPTTVGLSGEFFKDGAEHLARAAPRGPEIDEDGDALAAVKDVGLEI